MLSSHGLDTNQKRRRQFSRCSIQPLALLARQDHNKRYKINVKVLHTAVYSSSELATQKICSFLGGSDFALALYLKCPVMKCLN